MNRQEFNTGLMNLAGHMTMGRHIRATIDAAKESGQYVQISSALPAVHVYRGEDDEFSFQEHEAREVLNEANKLAEEFGLWLNDALLYIAQSW